ncbi:MAG: outer membrane beta-barrel domain-containing protein, partial [Deltaproteobacteria bacterium]
MLALVACLGGLPLRSQAGEAGAWSSERYGPIQRRLFDLGHELSLGFSYLPLDAYYKGYGAQIAYTIHFNHV